MKSRYERLEIEVIAFEKKDVITASAMVVEKDNDNGYAKISTFSSFGDFWRS